MAEAQTQRLTSDERKALLIDAAEQTFVSRGYSQAGLAEVANLAGVSKTLLYHYFPEGRPELYREVMERLLGEVLDALRAVPASTPPEQRIEALVGALVGHFVAHPDTYRLLVLEPWGSRDPSVVGQAMAVRNRLAGELNQLLAESGAAASTILAGGAATLGAALQVCELALAGQLAEAEAVDDARRFVRGGLAALDVL